MSVLEKIKALDEQKEKLLKEAKQEALKNARNAINDLNSLGFNYQLVQGDISTTSSRRTGMRGDIQTLLSSNPAGMKRIDVLEAMNVKGNKRGEQSVSNALAALKKAGAVSREADGTYKIAS